MLWDSNLIRCNYFNGNNVYCNYSRNNWRYFCNSSGGLDREATDKELSGGVVADGVSSFIAAIFGVAPNTSFSQNVGLVAVTKVVNKFVIMTGAVFLILAGFFPKLSAILSVMPQSVLGGAQL